MFHGKLTKLPPLWIYYCYPLLNDSEHPHKNWCRALYVLYEFYAFSHEKFSSRAEIVSNALVFYWVTLFFR